MRILVVISNDLWVRNYIRTDALAVLEREHEVRVTASDAVTIRKELESKKGFLGFFATSERSVRRQGRLFNLLTFRHRKRSRTFSFRLKRVVRWDLLRAPEGESSKQRKMRLKEFFRHNLSRDRTGLMCLFLGNPLVFPLSSRILQRSIEINRELEAKADEANPDLILLPSSAYDPVGNDAVRIAARRGIKSMYLIDNWDNLSSKTVFWVKPDSLGIWSEQQRGDAVRIHGFHEEQLHVIGTPRFDLYFRVRDDPGPSPFDFPYVLFTGCALPFDETAALRLLEQELEQHGDLYGDLKIVYRPHPWRQNRREERFVESEFKHVVLDPQIREGFLAQLERKGRGTRFQPDLGYYPALLANALFNMGPLTTMLIESMIFRQFFLAICYDDGKHFTSPHNALRYYEHFDGIENLPGIRLCRESAEMGRILRELYRADRKVERRAWDESLEYYLRIDETPYPERLRRACVRVMESTRGPRE